MNRLPRDARCAAAVRGHVEERATDEDPCESQEREWWADQGSSGRARVGSGDAHDGVLGAGCERHDRPVH